MRSTAPFLAIAFLLVASVVAITIGVAHDKARRGELIILTRGAMP